MPERGASLNGPGGNKKTTRQSGDTPEDPKRLALDSAQMANLALSPQSLAQNQTDEQRRMNPNGTPIIVHPNRVFQNGEDAEEEDDNDFLDAWNNEAPVADHDAYDELLGAFGEEAVDNDANIIALKEEGDNDLQAQLQHEVVVIALPAKVAEGKGKGKGGKTRDNDDRRGDASKGRFKFALMGTVGLFVDGDAAYEHVKDLPSRVKDGPKGATGIISFQVKNSKEKLLSAVKVKKSSLNGAIGGFMCRFVDPDADIHAKYEGYVK